MTRKQTENTAKYLYDISKIIFTLAVLGNLLAKERFDLNTLLGGIVSTILIFLWAFILDRGGE